MSLLHFYRTPGIFPSRRASLLTIIREQIRSDVHRLESELCFNVELTSELSEAQEGMLSWLLRETFQPEGQPIDKPPEVSF